MADNEKVEPIWNDNQLGFLDGTAPKTLRNGQKGCISASAVQITREKFVDLLGQVGGRNIAFAKRATTGSALGYSIGRIEQPAAPVSIPVAA